MFSQISWTLYVQTMSMLTAFYYAAVLLLYFRKDFSLSVLSKQRNSVAGRYPISQQVAPSEEYRQRGEGAADQKRGSSYELLVGTLRDEIKAFLAEAGKAGFTKEQILSSLQVLLDKYASVKTSPYKEAIQKLIKEDTGQPPNSILLSEQEIEHLFTA